MNTSIESGKPLKAGDLVVESVGSEIRFWEVREGEKKVQKIATSYTLPSFGRVLQFTPQTAGAVPATESGKELTPARLFKDKSQGAALLRKRFPHRTIHFFYSGHGPSGNSWCFYPDRSHATVEVSE